MTEASRSRGLIWLASYPKSGNTWLRAFLHNFLRNGPAPHDINRLLDLTATENDASLYRRLDPRPASLYSVDDVQRMREHVHRAISESFPDHVLVKTHNARIEVAGRPLVTPEVTAGAIYIVRDPRDVAISYGSHLNLPVDEVIAMMAEPGAATGSTDAQVFERLGTWSQHVASWIEPDGKPLLVLRYEDMHAAPLETFGRVARFLGAPAEPARLDRAIRFSRFDELAAQERAQGFIERPAAVERFFGHGRPGLWRSVLSAPQAFRLKRSHAAVMARFGYR